MKKNASFEIELRGMTVLDWNEYVKRVVDANELYFQYGYEPSEELIECISTMTPSVVYYSVYLSTENALVGYVGITPETSSLEFYIFPDFRNRGIGTNAAQLLIQSWFAGQISGKMEPEITAETLSENLASIKLLEKIGFKKDAVGLRVTFEQENVNDQAIGLFSYVLKNDCIANDNAPKSVH